jgi:hypothetical protein
LLPYGPRHALRSGDDATAPPAAEKLPGDPASSVQDDLAIFRPSLQQATDNAADAGGLLRELPSIEAYAHQPLSFR